MKMCFKSLFCCGFRCLADIDVDGNLSPDEFCVAMFLIELAKSGQPVPSVLPPSLIPPSSRRLRRASETLSTAPLPMTNMVMAPGEITNIDVLFVSMVALCAWNRCH